MHNFNSRVGGAMLRLTLVAALAACVDETTPMEPIRALDPQFGVGDVIMVTNTSGGTDIGSLRWAATHVTGGEVIRFDPSLAGKTIVLDTTLVIKSKSVTIEGPSAGITISGGGKGRVLDIGFFGSAKDTSVLRNLTITGGKLTAAAGNGDIAAGVDAGYVSLVVENSTIAGNEAGRYPAIDALNLILINSTVSGNTATSTTNPTPPVLEAAELTLVHSTVAHNHSAGVLTTRLRLRNSVVAKNARGQNCLAVTSIVREGWNLSDDSTCGAPFELTIADPLLAGLAHNGGPSATHALQVGSPAINAGSSCNVVVDQRYAPRDAQCDLGAYEFADFTTVDITAAGSGAVDHSNGWVVLSGTIRCSRDETFDLHVELEQLQKTQPGRTPIDVHAAATTPIQCTPSVRPWSVALFPTDEPFQPGSATATAGTFGAQPWVKPAFVTQSVRLFNARK